MQIYGVAGDFPNSIVLAENVLGGLFVVRVCLRSVLFALLAETMGTGAVTFVVCLMRLGREVLVLSMLLSREVAQSIIFLL